MKDVLGGTVMLVLVLGLVAAVGIYVAGGGDGSWTYESRFVVNTERDRVLDMLSDPRYRSEWVQGIKESAFLDAGRAHQGARLREVVQVDGELEERTVEIIAFDPGNKLELRTTSPGLVMSESFVFSGTVRKTHVLYRSDIAQEGLRYMLFEPIFSAGFDTRLKNGLDKLTAIAETTY